MSGTIFSMSQTLPKGTSASCWKPTLKMRSLFARNASYPATSSGLRRPICARIASASPE
jgi:hypothetical protein